MGEIRENNDESFEAASQMLEAEDEEDVNFDFLGLKEEEGDEL